MEIQQDTLIIFWLALALIMGVAEALSINLITVWFVVGALIAFLSNILGAALIVQAALFLVVSLFGCILFRPYVRRRLKQPVQEGDDLMIGRIAKVIEDIDPNKQTGRVRTADRITWMAISQDGSFIPAGSHVRVHGHDSIKLIVSRCSDDQGKELDEILANHSAPYMS